MQSGAIIWLDSVFLLRSVPQTIVGVFFRIQREETNSFRSCKHSLVAVAQQEELLSAYQDNLRFSIKSCDSIA